MTEKAKRLVRIASAIIFGNKTSDNRTPSIKEIKRDTGTLVVTITPFPNGKTQLYIRYNDDCNVGSGLSMSAEFNAFKEATNIAEQIENSFCVWKK